MTVSDAGEAFEVTADGVVRRFLNPETDAEGRRPTFFSLVRHSPACLQAARDHLAGNGAPDPDACLLP